MIVIQKKIKLLVKLEDVYKEGKLKVICEILYEEFRAEHMDFIDSPATNTSILDEDLKVMLFGFAIEHND